MSKDKSLENKGQTLKPSVLDGRKLRDAGSARLKAMIEKSGIKPTLVIIQVGGLAESTAYIGQKRKFAEKIGAGFIHEQFSEDVAEAALLKAIQKWNNDVSVHGIIVQLPIPARLDKQKIIDCIIPGKDADGLTSVNKKLFEAGDRKAIVPATARGVLSLLRGYGVATKGKKVTVIGRSALVGTPIATLLRREGADVTVCHKGTPDIPAKARSSDILVVAAGSPRLVTRDYVRAGQVIVDVGINSVDGDKLEDEIPRRRLVGDVDFDAVKSIVGAISPVPGGVGPMTVLSLFENLCDAAGVSFR